MKIKFTESKTAFRIINGIEVSDEEIEKILKNKKNPFVKIEKGEDTWEPEDQGHQD